MTLTLTYDSALSRVRLAADGLGTALTATFERSTNEINWTTVRGGLSVTVDSSEASVDDYEFAPDVENFYRVRYTAEITYVGRGVGGTLDGNNASVTRALPVGHAAGDLLLTLASIRNSPAGSPNTLAGWTKLIDSANMCLFGKIDNGAETDPVVQTFSGGVANATTLADVAAFRGVKLPPFGTPTQQLNGSGQDIAAPAITLPGDLAGGLNVWVGWKQDDWTSVAVVSGGTEIMEMSSTTGDDAGMVWDYRILPNSTVFANLSGRTFTVTGGGAAISRGGTAVFEHSIDTQTDSITPTLGGHWLKSIQYPFLNFVPTRILGPYKAERATRPGVFDIVGRSLPVAVSDVSRSRQIPLAVRVSTRDEQKYLDALVASGSCILVHSPAASRLPTLYAVAAGSVSFEHMGVGDEGIYRLALTEVAAPSSVVVGATLTCQTVINSYATCADVIAAEATCADLLEGIGTPGDVIVS